MSIITLAGGIQLNLDDLPLTITWDGEFVATISTVLNGVTYRQTYTNDGTNITAISRWVAV